MDHFSSVVDIMGYDTTQDICGHGFRTMACSALIESGLWLKWSTKTGHRVRVFPVSIFRFVWG
ncbi:hypothetical protein DM870_26055 [Escherichia coli]|nr:hypothetical protein DM870_26055 [Escherichia coli]